MNEKRRSFLDWLISLVAENVYEKEETTYYRKPSGENEYAIIGIDAGHNDIAERIFQEEGYDDIKKK